MRRSLTELFFPRGVFPNSVEDGWGYEGSSNTRAAFFSLPWIIKAVGNELDAEKVTLVPMQASGALQNSAGLQNMSDGLTAIWRERGRKKQDREESPQKIELILLHPVFYIVLLELFRSLCQFFFGFLLFSLFPISSSLSSCIRSRRILNLCKTALLPQHNHSCANHEHHERK